MRPLKAQLITFCEQRNIKHEVFETKDKKIEVRWWIKMEMTDDLLVTVELTKKNQYTAFLDHKDGRNVGWLIHFDIYEFVCWLNNYGLIS